VKRLRRTQKMSFLGGTSEVEKGKIYSYKICLFRKLQIMVTISFLTHNNPAR
jgi:hypothetical protein